RARGLRVERRDRCREHALEQRVERRLRQYRRIARGRSGRRCRLARRRRRGAELLLEAPQQPAELERMEELPDAFEIRRPADEAVDADGQLEIAADRRELLVQVELVQVRPEVLADL